MAYCNYTSLIYWRKYFPTGNNEFHVTLKDTAMETYSELCVPVSLFRLHGNF